MFSLLGWPVDEGRAFIRLKQEVAIACQCMHSGRYKDGNSRFSVYNRLGAWIWNVGVSSGMNNRDDCRTSNTILAIGR
jgi:hypothetical protein